MSKFKWWVNGLEGGGLADSFAGAHAEAGEAIHALGADVCEYSVAEVTHIFEQDNTDDGQYDFYNLACNVLNEMDSIIGTDIFSSLCIGDVQNIGWNLKLMIESLTADNPKFYIPIAHTVRCYVYRSDEWSNQNAKLQIDDTVRCYVYRSDEWSNQNAKLQIDDTTIVAKQSLSVESAAHVRADRIVASKTNPADKARERGFRDAMMGVTSRRNEFSKISQVSYDQGVERAKKTREILNVRGLSWMETEIERDGSKWRWAVYEEGKHIASGDAKSEKSAGQAVDDARVSAAEKRSQNKA